MSELRVEGLVKSYAARSSPAPRVVLDEVDLRVPSGTLTAVLGASGSGKTTLLRVIIGFDEADAGSVVVGGRVVAQGRRTFVPPERRAIGYVAQEGALFPHVSVGENVGFGLSRKERKASLRVAEVLELVGLGAKAAARRPHELSGGEQRRVALGRALAPRPRLVLLDEPFSALDASLRTETRKAVLDALAGEGTTAVLVTHDQAEALSMGREVAVLRDGHLVQTASPGVLYRTPADLEVARFVGDAVVLPGEAAGGVVRCALGSLPLAGSIVEGPVLAMVRPEQVRLVADPGISGKVVATTFYGPEAVVQVCLDGGEDLVVDCRLAGHVAPAPGEPVAVAVEGSAVAYPLPGSGA